ncbi:YjiH family protein [Natronolimnohabitans innermongolicus]|uniref:Transporter gate domain protein n=1 Tax=Natronolimnohabitans innermongolicus JCM 12255 TaxID=1227499 RepID=L9WLU6_9EURY|nr:nucleoside recognition domain-containing protein [Natronolimnohabitans innermongolicus]ELY50445.1 transporter gate domain protein [Natronolimnohabitans innermongolicus JCM 12255]
MLRQDAWRSDTETWEHAEPDEQTIDEDSLTETETIPFVRFVTVFSIGLAFFVLPVPWGETVTVPFDIFVGIIEANAAQYVLGMAWLMVVGSALLTTVSEFHSRRIYELEDETVDRLSLELWETNTAFWALRILGAVIATGFLFEVGPALVLDPDVSGIVWGTLILSIVIIIPLGSIFVNMLIECGALEFVGTLARPVMQPLFGLPGRSALDGAASWAGSFAIGFYVTRTVFDRGGYNKREVFIICSCFGTASIGTIGVFAAAFDMLHIFPVILLAYLIAILAAAIVTIRIPPLSRVPEEYIAEPNVEPKLNGSAGDYVRLALSEAMEESKGTSSVRAGWKGLVDGIVLTATITGTVVAVGTLVLLTYHNTQLFQLISTPLEPVIAAFGIPDADVVASALIIGFAEMYVGALMATGLAPMAQFFVILVVSGQILFLAASGPMMMDMFTDIPVRLRDITAIFVVRTLVLIPISAALTHAVNLAGLL